MPECLPTSDRTRQENLLARFRAMLRPDVQIAQATDVSASRLDVTIQMPDGRTGTFAVVFLDGPGRPKHAILIVERDAPTRASGVSPVHPTYLTPKGVHP